MVYIHPGFAKTGTTYLQEIIFKKLPIAYRGRHLNVLTKEDSAFFDALRGREEVEYDEARLQVESHTDASILLISEEQLTYNFGAYQAIDRSQIARRLKRLFPEAKILFTIRNQLALYTSLYTFFMTGDRYNFKTFDQWFSEDDARYPLIGSHFNLLKFNEIIEVYEELFGVENILILCQEELAQQQDVYLNNLLSFFGMSDFELEFENKRVNETKSESMLKLRKILSSLGMTAHMQKSLIANASKILPLPVKNQMKKLFAIGKKAEVSLSPEQENIIRGLVKEGNRKLDKKYSLNLEQYGYPL